MALSGGGGSSSSTTPGAGGGGGAAAGSGPLPALAQCAKTWNDATQGGNMFAQLIGQQEDYGAHSQGMAQVAESLQNPSGSGCIISQQTTNQPALNDPNSWVQVVYPIGGPVSLTVGGQPAFAESTQGDRPFAGLGSQNVKANTDGYIQFLGVLAAYNSRIDYGQANSTGGGVAPPSSETSSPSTGGSQTTDATSYANQIMAVISTSRRQLAKAVKAISAAKSDPYGSDSKLVDVASARQDLLGTVNSWVPPSGGDGLQRLLAKTLRLSVVSDQLYASYAADLAAGAQSTADSDYSKAGANDKIATKAKQAFMQAYNAYREQNGLALIPTDKLY
jgi:hypothetical protein